VTLERPWAMLAHLQGSTLNAAQIARALELTARRYRFSDYDYDYDND